MAFPFSKKKNKKKEELEQQQTQNSTPDKKIKVVDTEEKIQDKNVSKFIEQYRKELLKDSVTKEDVIQEVYNVINQRKNNRNNVDPFKTRDDIYITIYKDNLGDIKERLLPFEKIEVNGKQFYINKTFENFEIKINYLFNVPQNKIDINDEFSRRSETKKKLDKIKQKISFIQSKRGEGYSDYSKVDIKELLNEEHKLSTILETIPLLP